MSLNDLVRKTVLAGGLALSVGVGYGCGGEEDEESLCEAACESQRNHCCNYNPKFCEEDNWGNTQSKGKYYYECLNETCREWSEDFKKCVATGNCHSDC